MSYLLTFIGGMLLVGTVWFINYWRKDKDAVQELIKIKAEKKTKAVIDEIINKELPTTKPSKLDRFKQLMGKNK